MIDITELAQRVERIISDMKLKHGGNDTYAPVMKWDEFLALVEALEKAQQRINSQREYYEGVIADGGKRIAELESRTRTAAASDVLAERQRQVTAEGWTPEHDDEHSDGEMALAASSYALYAHKKPIAPAMPYNWPWESSRSLNPITLVLATVSTRSSSTAASSMASALIPATMRSVAGVSGLSASRTAWITSVSFSTHDHSEVSFQS